MSKPIYYLTAICLSAVLLCALPCRAGERGAMQESLSIRYANVAGNAPAPAGVEFNFVNSYDKAVYSSNANLLQLPGRGHYQRENRGRTVAGRIITWTGSALTLAGAIMVASTDWKDPADRQKRTIGMVGMGAGLVFVTVGLALSGDKLPFYDYRPMYRGGRWGY